MSAFEFSGLGGQSCSESNEEIWVTFEKYESCGDEKTKRHLINRYKGIEYNWLEGIFVGKFLADGRFGHMGAKPFQLNVSCIESVTLLPKTNAGCQRVDETSPFFLFGIFENRRRFCSKLRK